MKLAHHSKTGYVQEIVKLPLVSVGECRNSLRCRNFVTDLANGYCVDCWDKGLDQRRKSNLGKSARRKPNGQYNSRSYSNRLSWGNGGY